MQNSLNFFPRSHGRNSAPTPGGASPRHFLHYRRTSLAMSALAAVLLLPMAALADTVVLKNGDHLTGTVNQLAGGKLTVTTSYAGAVTISFDEVTSIKLDKPLILPIETRKGKQVDIKRLEITAIDRTATGLVVTTASGPEPAPKFDTLRTDAAQKAYEASLRPNFLHGWTATANLSLALARGNADTTTFGLGATGVRPTSTDKTTLYFNEIYTHDGLADATTANNLGAGVRYDHNLNPKLFAFGTGDFYEDQLQFLDLRSVLGGGFGWHARNKPKEQLDVLGGVVWTHESYSTVPGTPPVAAYTNSFAALDFGEQYTRKFGGNSVFTEQAYIFPDLADTSQYRATGTTTLSTKLKSFLSWQTTASDVYVTNPPTGTKTNDLILTTGLGFTFTRK